MNWVIARELCSRRPSELCTRDTHASTCKHQCQLLDTRMHVINAVLSRARAHHATVSQDRWSTASTKHRCTDALLHLKLNTQDQHVSTVARMARTEDRCWWCWKRPLPPHSAPKTRHLLCMHTRNRFEASSPPSSSPTADADAAGAGDEPPEATGAMLALTSPLADPRRQRVGRNLSAVPCSINHAPAGHQTAARSAACAERL